MVELGRLHEDGHEWGSAAHWYENAAALGNADAQGRLGLLYSQGNGVQKDLSKAIEWWQKAASQGQRNAQASLGIAYYRGDGVEVDRQKGLEWLLKAAEAGLPQAQIEIGAMYWNGAPNTPQSHEKAVQWYTKAAVQGDADAESRLGSAYLWGFGTVKNLAIAKDWFLKAAKHGNAEAMTALGRMYRDGKGVPKDDLIAFEWMQRAAVQGNRDGQEQAGKMFALGRGVTSDVVLAYAWLNIAAASQDPWEGVATPVEPNANKIRDELLTPRMTPEEISEAQRLSTNWRVGKALARESVTANETKQPASRSTLVKKKAGTAFIVNAAGHAITNHHIVDGCAEVRAQGREGAAKVVTTDAVNDLAELQIPGTAEAQATIAGDPAKLRQGEDIVVFGFPLNAVLSSGGNLTPGVVSALTGLGNNTNQIQITAPIQPGSSGSPVVNRKGEVVGVVAMKLSDAKMATATGQVGQNVNFAVSGQTLKTFLDTHKVAYRTGNTFSFGAKSTADLADEARKWTLVVECWR